LASILRWTVAALGAPHTGERSEKELISSFVDRIAKLSPQLVTFMDRRLIFLCCDTAQWFMESQRRASRSVTISTDIPKTQLVYVMSYPTSNCRA
jgi:hypothetical protein